MLRGMLVCWKYLVFVNEEGMNCDISVNMEFAASRERPDVE